MAVNIRCPGCGEDEALWGTRAGGVIHLVCERCGAAWERDLTPRCERCGGDDLQAAHLAIVEKSRGTQLSVVGTRVVHLCPRCDAADLDRYYRNLPNPLMPERLPTVNDEGVSEL